MLAYISVLEHVVRPIQIRLCRIGNMLQAQTHSRCGIPLRLGLIIAPIR